MKRGFLKYSYLGLALGLSACSSGQLGFQGGSADIQLPPAAEVVKIKKEATVQPEEQYINGQAYARLTHEDALVDVLANLSANGVNARLLDKVPNRPIYLLEIKSATSVPEVVQELKKDKLVVSAGVNGWISAESIRASDPLVTTQWALHNFGQEAPHALAGKSGADIGMESVTAQGSKDIVVGVIDTGID